MPREETAMSQQTIERGINRITFSELAASIRTVIETGRPGTPVNVRLHWEFRESKDELPAITIGAIALADEALQLDRPTWRMRKHSTGKTLNVLGSDRQGRTVMITLVAEAEPRTAMTVFGNHGIVRLEHGWVDPGSIPQALDSCDWFPDLQAALAG